MRDCLRGTGNRTGRSLERASRHCRHRARPFRADSPTRADQLPSPPRPGADAELPAGQNTNLFPWLRAHYRVWASRTPEDTRTAVIVGCAELALSGCTTVFDHAYVFQNGCKVDDQIHAAAEIGVRFAVSRGSMSLGESKGGLPPDDCVEDEDAIMRDSLRVIQQYHDPNPGSMLQIVLAPCSPFSVTADLMRESAKLARNTASSCIRISARLSTRSATPCSIKGCGQSPTWKR